MRALVAEGMMVDDEGERVEGEGETVLERRLDEPVGGRQITVDLEDRTERVGIDPGTFLQRSGVSLFLKVLLVTSAVVAALFINLMVELAQVPRAPSGHSLAAAFAAGDTARALRLAAQYRVVSEVIVAQRDAAWAHFVLGVKEVVVTVLLPLMTGILGYIFGTRSEAAAHSATRRAWRDDPQLAVASATGADPYRMMRRSAILFR